MTNTQESEAYLPDVATQRQMLEQQITQSKQQAFAHLISREYSRVQGSDDKAKQEAKRSAQVADNQRTNVLKGIDVLQAMLDALPGDEDANS